MEFVCAELLGLTHEFNFWGNAFNYSNKQDVSIKGRIKNYNDSISGIWTGMNSMISSASPELIPIIVNGVNLGSGYITSMSFDESTDIRLKEYTVGFSIYKHAGSGLYDNYGLLSMTGTEYSGLSSVVSAFNSAAGKYITDFTENSSYNILSSGRYSYNKDISFGIDTGVVSEVGIPVSALCLNFISLVKQSYTDTNVISAFYPDFYKFNSGILKTTQSFDVINHQFNYSEVFNFDSGRNYTWKYNNDISMDNGVVTVSENGDIISSQLIGYASKAAEDGWSDIETGIYNRILNIYSDYTGIINQSGLCSLKNQPESESVVRDRCIGSIRYSKSYSNSPFIQTGYSHSYNSSISLDEDGYISVSEGGSFKSYRNIQPSGFITAYSGLINSTGQIVSRINNLYSSYGSGLRQGCSYTNTLNQESSEVIYREFDGEVDYSYNYSENPSFVNANGVYKVTVNNSIEEPTHIVNYFPISYDRVIPQKMSQSTRGIYSNSIEIQGRGLTLNQFINVATGYLTSPSGTDIILTEYSYSLEPLESKFNMNASYSFTNYRNGGDFLV